MPGAVLRTLPLEEAFSRAFLHFKDIHFNILLLRLLCKLLLSFCHGRRSGRAWCAEAFGFYQARREAGRRGYMLLFLVGHAWLTIRKHDVILP